ncbi:hypothetical protein ADK35_07270 [Streptomyces viridochromogenes]|nr:hypothetical protein ADK36_06580 [Streptomyces viridochromogenes]KOG26470.1 hypothetical protein ADK35_07270 [Streptomyces viridochromogenes]
MAPFAPWTSLASRGTVPATPGWNTAAATPLTKPIAQICHSTTCPEKKSAAAGDWVPTRTRSAPTISLRVLKRSATTPPKMMSPARAADVAANARPTAPAP